MKVQVDDDEGEAEVEDDENKPVPLNESDLFYRPCDDVHVLK